jgi:hypothetical protein
MMSWVGSLTVAYSFENRCNADPIALADRLWVKNHLDPEEEILRVSS